MCLRQRLIHCLACGSIWILISQAPEVTEGEAWVLSWLSLPVGIVIFQAVCSRFVIDRRYAFYHLDVEVFGQGREVGHPVVCRAAGSGSSCSLDAMEGSGSQPVAKVLLLEWSNLQEA